MHKNGDNKLMTETEKIDFVNLKATSLKWCVKQTKPLVSLIRKREKGYKYTLETREDLTTDSEESEKK